MSEDIYILGIESSCDETAAAVVKNGREVLSNIIASQVPIHRKHSPQIRRRSAGNCLAQPYTQRTAGNR